MARKATTTSAPDKPRGIAWIAWQREHLKKEAQLRVAALARVLSTEAAVCWDRDQHGRSDMLDAFVCAAGCPTYEVRVPTEDGYATVYVEFVTDPVPHWRQWGVSDGYEDLPTASYCAPRMGTRATAWLAALNVLRTERRGE